MTGTRRGSVLLSVLLLAFTLGTAAPAAAQSFDAQFCGMVAGLEDGATAVSNPTAGRATRAPVEVSRHLEVGLYVVVVQLTAPATEAQLLPAETFPHEDVRIEGNRIVSETHVPLAGQVTLRFLAPRGTRYRVGFYLMPPQRSAGLGLRASALVEEHAPCIDCGAPPDCVRPPSTMGLGGLVTRTR